MMDREQYLKNLEDVLKESFTQQQMNDILADYSEFFDAGIAEGKSENELCAEFGSPEKVALKLRNENTNAQKFHFKRQCLKAICLFLSLVSLAFIRFLGNNLVVFLCSLIVLCLFMQTIVFMSGSHKEHPAYSSMPPKYHWMKSALLICSPIFLILFSAAMILNNYILSTEFHASPNDDFSIYQELGIYHFAFDCINIAALLLLAFICVIAAIVTVKTKAYSWMKYGLLICYFCFFALFSGFVFSIIDIFIRMKSEHEIPDFDMFFMNDYIFNLLFALLIFAGIFLICYAVFINLKMKWLLFFNTALVGFLTYLYYSMHYVNFTPDSSAYPIILNSFSFSFGPVAIAAVLYLLFLHMQKSIQVRKENCYERADEKGNS